MKLEESVSLIVISVVALFVIIILQLVRCTLCQHNVDKSKTNSRATPPKKACQIEKLLPLRVIYVSSFEDQSSPDIKIKNEGRVRNRKGYLVKHKDLLSPCANVFSDKDPLSSCTQLQSPDLTSIYESPLTPVRVDCATSCPSKSLGQAGTRTRENKVELFNHGDRNLPNDSSRKNHNATVEYDGSNVCRQRHGSTERAQDRINSNDGIELRNIVQDRFKHVKGSPISECLEASSQSDGECRRLHHQMCKDNDVRVTNLKCAQSSQSHKCTFNESRWKSEEKRDGEVQCGQDVSDSVTERLQAQYIARPALPTIITPSGVQVDSFAQLDICSPTRYGELVCHLLRSSRDSRAKQRSKSVPIPNDVSDINFNIALSTDSARICQKTRQSVKSCDQQSGTESLYGEISIRTSKLDVLGGEGNFTKQGYSELLINSQSEPTVGTVISYHKDAKKDAKIAQRTRAQGGSPKKQQERRQCWRDIVKGHSAARPVNSEQASLTSTPGSERQMRWTPVRTVLSRQALTPECFSTEADTTLSKRTTISTSTWGITN